MILTKNEVHATKHTSLHFLVLVSLVMIVVASLKSHSVEAAPGFNDRRIYPNWDRRFDHRIRLAKKSFEDDIIDHPSTRAIASEGGDQDAIDRAIQLLLKNYLVTKNDIGKRDYIRLM